MKRIQSSPTCTLYAHVVFRGGTGCLPVGGHLECLLPLTMNGNMLFNGFVKPGSKNLIGRTQLKVFFNNLWCNLCATSFMSTFTRIAHCVTFAM